MIPPGGTRRMTKKISLNAAPKPGTPPRPGKNQNLRPNYPDVFPILGTFAKGAMRWQAAVS